MVKKFLGGEKSVAKIAPSPMAIGGDRMNILIKNCNLISVNPEREQYEQGVDILIDNNLIKAIGENLAEAGIGTVDKVIDATGKVVMPGLINTHSHIPMSIFKENLDGYSLQEWLTQKIWPAEDKLTDEDIYNASMMSFREMVRTGTTTIVDMYFMQDNIIKAAEDTGVRVELTRTLMDSDGTGERKLQEIEELIKKYANKNENITYQNLQDSKRSTKRDVYSDKTLH